MDESVLLHELLAERELDLHHARLHASQPRPQEPHHGLTVEVRLHAPPKRRRILASHARPDTAPRT